MNSQAEMSELRIQKRTACLEGAYKSKFKPSSNKCASFCVKYGAQESTAILEPTAH